MENEPAIPNGIPPAAPRYPQKHLDQNVDIIIKIFEEIQNFTINFMNHYLRYLIPDELSYLVPEFQQRMIPIMRQKIQDITSAILELQDTNDLKKRLVEVEMADQSLEFKDRSFRGHVNRFYNFIRQGLLQGASWTKSGFIKGLKAIADSVFKAINSVLGSLGKALDYLPGVGAAIDVIKQIKEHLDAASTAVKEHEK
jgi:hypothetical protein